MSSGLRSVRPDDWQGHVHAFSDNSYGLNEPHATDGGQTTIQVDITESAAVPEPVSIGLLYGSALGLGLLIRRRVAK